MLPTHILTLLAVIMLALFVYMPEVLLIIIPTMAIFMLLNSPVQSLTMRKVPIPVQKKQSQSRPQHRDY